MTRPPATDSLMAIDIGNSRIGMGVWDADGIHDTSRVAAADTSACSEALQRTWEQTRFARSRAIVLGSVSPAVDARVRHMALDLLGIEPLRVREDLPLPMPLDVDPESVGVDRVCSAAAAYDRVREACAVASFGTAITVDCVSADGRFMGGAILPGLQMACDALHEHTALLPQVELTEPPSVFGRNTRDAILSGVVYGAGGALREIVERFATELGQWPQLVATGGNAALIQAHADFVDAVVPDLCLMGIALAYRRAAGQP